MTGGYRAEVNLDNGGRCSTWLGAASGRTADRAIGNALDRPCLRFYADNDECIAEVAAFRRRAIEVRLVDREIKVLGLV